MKLNKFLDNKVGLIILDWVNSEKKPTLRSWFSFFKTFFNFFCVIFLQKNILRYLP